MNTTEHNMQMNRDSNLINSPNCQAECDARYQYACQQQNHNARQYPTQ